MKENIVIKVSDLSKKYLKKNEKGESKEFFALKDISFNVRKGDVIGIVGKNGSGKSTLLKILSGITKPDSGEIEITGKVASILDIGMGMHPDLSGRENVYLRGELAGMSKKEIDSVYNDIVEFSEIEEFINSPVKNYSSGMFLRLAFSSLIYLNADILLLDEVLAVGDTGFLEKAKNYLKNNVFNNKTVLVISHNIAEIANCNTFFVLQEGKLISNSRNHISLDNYIISTKKINKIYTSNVLIEDFSCDSEEIQIKKISLNQDENSFKTNKPFVFEIEYEKLRNENDIDIVLSVNDIEGNNILLTTAFVKNNFANNSLKGIYVEKCTLSPNIFNSQIYSLGIIALKNTQEVLDNSVRYLQSNSTNTLLTLKNLFYFKPVCYKFDKPIDLSLLKLNSKLLIGFEWEIKKI